MWNSWGGKLKQSEIDFYSQMIKFVSSKNNCDSPNPNETGSDLKEDENKKIAENERIEIEVPILWAKWVYNSYFKIKSLDTHPENSSSEVKILKREQADAKSSYNIKSEIQKKAESDKVLNWRTERNYNVTSSICPDQSFPLIKSK